MDEQSEKVFTLCPCNHQPEARGEDRREEPDRARNIVRKKPTRRRIGVIKLRVELW
jgi:hypothetical protein